MLRRSRFVLLPLLTAAIAFGQLVFLNTPGQMRQNQTPIDSAIQAYYDLGRQGHREEAAARREQARALLDNAPLESQQYIYWVQSVTQMYEQSGRTVEVRNILQTALARGNRLPDWHPVRVFLLTNLANSYQRDGYLLKAVTYLEQAARAADKAPAEAYNRFPGPNPNTWQQLADLDRRLGRPEAAAEARSEAVARTKDNPSALAWFYQTEGLYDQAEAVFKQMADESQDPRQTASALQSLANVYRMDGQLGDAVSAMEKAVALYPLSGEGIWMRQNLAGMLQQAGKTDQAEQIYRQLLGAPDAEQYNVVLNYSNFLSNSQRHAQAEKLLTDYLANHPDLNEGMAYNLLNNLANATKDPKQAEEYRRQAAAKMLQPQPSTGNSVGEILREAQNAANDKRPDDAFALAMEAIAAAPTANDRDSIVWTIQNVTANLAINHADRADELYRRVIETAEGWSRESVQSLLQAYQNYLHFLLNQPNRESSVPPVLERYGALYSEAHGAELGTLEVLDWTVRLQSRPYFSPPAPPKSRFSDSRNELFKAADERASVTAQDLLRLEESLSGTTSEPYLNVLNQLIHLYQSSEPERALPLYRQTIAIADLVARPNDTRPIETRIQAARAFAGANQFEEAERLASEAIALGKALRHPQDRSAELTQIRRMEKTAAQ